MHSIRVGSVLDLLPTYPNNFFGGALLDPPYELGFMNRVWDSSGIAFSPIFWREMFRVLQPGAYVLACGHPRTVHRLVCAIEDSGFEVRDQICWLYGQGFPKSHACLKGGYEPVCLARKPDKRGKPLNIDGCRISPGVPVQGGGANFVSWRRLEGRDFYQGKPTQPHSKGRWPTNLLLDETVAADLDAQCGVRKRAGSIKGNIPRTAHSCYGDLGIVPPFEGYGDMGGVSRYFYCPKASRAERDAGLEGFELKPSYMAANGSKTSGSSDGKRHDRTTMNRNFHPCVKPMGLTTYLAKLILPPGNGHLLVPFSGSGSEMIGALQAGWDSVTGIELSPAFVQVADARLRHHQGLGLSPATETQAYRAAGRLGGLSVSEVKKAAARANGSKGGRPRIRVREFPPRPIQHCGRPERH